MTVIEVDEETADALKARAELLGMSLQDYLRSLTQPGQAPPSVNLPEFDRLLDELADDLPPLPADFSRAHIYADHD